MCFVLFVPPQMFCSLFQDDVRPKDPLPVLPCIMYLLHIYISFGANNDVLLWKLKLASINLPVPVCVFLLRLLTCSRLFIILNPTPNPLAILGAVHWYHNLWVTVEKHTEICILDSISHKINCFPFCDRSYIKHLLCLQHLPTSDHPKAGSLIDLNKPSLQLHLQQLQAISPLQQYLKQLQLHLLSREPNWFQLR